MCTDHNPNEACGWPKKTIRGAIALIIIPIIILLMGSMMIMFFIIGQYESALGILSVLSGTSGSIIGYYFGSRSAESAADTISNMEHELIESKNMEIKAMGSRGFRYISNNNAIMEEDEIEEVVIDQ